VKILIFKENFQTRKHTIVKNSKEEHNFVANVKNLIRDLNILYINSKEDFENVVQEFTNNINEIWFKYLNLVNITKHSKLWWNEKCQISIKIQDDWMIEKVSRKQSKFSNKNFLIVRYKKFQTKRKVCENL